MKEIIMRCENCKDDTRHLTTKKISTTRTGYKTRRTVKHCCKCNMRTITNMKLGKTYTKGGK